MNDKVIIKCLHVSHKLGVIVRGFEKTQNSCSELWRVYFNRALLNVKCIKCAMCYS